MSELSITHRPYGKKHMNLRAVRLLDDINKQTKDHANFLHPGFT